MKIDRLAGAEAISQKAIRLGAENGVTVIECIWDVGEDLGHEYAHRLDIVTEGKTVRLYFSDLELTTSDNEGRKRRAEERVNNAIAQLRQRPHTPTYPFQ